MVNPSGPAPHHPIIDKPWQYAIVRFDVHRDPDRQHLDYLDLWLRREDEVRRLRFQQPTQIKIDDSFWNRSSGMVILDVRSWGWENVAVAVRDVENSSGGVSFNAKDVQEL